MTMTNATKVAKHDQNDDVDDNVDPAAPPTRRILSVEEKLDILARYEDCAPGQKGAFARREGVYSSQLTEWRRRTLSLALLLDQLYGPVYYRLLAKHEPLSDECARELVSSAQWCAGD